MPDGISVEIQVSGGKSGDGKNAVTGVGITTMPFCFSDIAIF